MKVKTSRIFRAEFVMWMFAKQHSMKVNSRIGKIEGETNEGEFAER